MHDTKGKSEDLMPFQVPKTHQVTTLNDVTQMQDIRAMTIPCLYCRSAFGGLG